MQKQRDNNYLYPPSQGDNSLHRLELRDSGYIVSNEWGIILNFTDILKRIDHLWAIRGILDYMEPIELASSLIMAPAIYESITIYEKLYDSIGGDFGSSDLAEMTDAIDEVYAEIIEKIERHISHRHKGKPYALNKWISPTDAFITSVKRL